MEFDRTTIVRVVAALVVVVGIYAVYEVWQFFCSAQRAPVQPSASAVPTLELTQGQLSAVKIAPAGAHVFTHEDRAVGSIDFNEDLSVQVFPPYQGKIISAFAQIGDEVQKGQSLYTIDSPDLVQAESNLISAAGVYDMTHRMLLRSQKLYATLGTGGIAEKDLDTAVSNDLTADGALKATCDALRVFGKTEAEIDKIVARRRIDPALVVRSPITGRITAREAQPGLLVQPGNVPAPYSVADISTMWMLANVPEIDSAHIHLEQPVRVTVIAYPGHVFEGKITNIGATVDPNVHTLLARAEIRDPEHQLRDGMLANFVISTGDPENATAVPVDSVIREPDGTMTVWVAKDQHQFVQRLVKIGLQRDGYDQILGGLNQGESVVTEGAIFLDNMLNAPPED
jgi:cobalt-zinc-cadmium efflux system membrane fusion protein